MQHLKIQRYIKTSVQKCFLQLCFIIFLTIVDFHETFDSVDHQVLWEVLKNCGILPEIITIILKLYKRFTCQAIHGETLTEPFPVTTAVRQGWLLSPLLFLPVIFWVSRTAQPKPEHLTLTSRLVDLDFPAYIFFLSLNYRLQDSQHEATNLKIIAKQSGLYINAQKTKTMKINPQKRNRQHQDQ